MKTNQVIVGCFLLMIGAVPVTAQTHEAASLRAQRRGMQVIHRGIEALGGFEAIHGVKTVRLNAEINGLTLGQAAHPGAGGNPSGGPPVYFNQVRHAATGLRVYEIFASDTSSQPGQRVAYREDGITNAPADPEINRGRFRHVSLAVYEPRSLQEQVPF